MLVHDMGYFSTMTIKSLIIQATAPKVIGDVAIPMT